MRTGTKVAVGAGAAVVVLGVTAALVGPGLYADWAGRATAEEPTLAATSSAVDPATMTGTWTVGEGSFAGYRVDEVLGGEDVTVTGRTEQVDGAVTLEEGTVTAAEIVVDMASVATDESRRDDYFRSRALHTDTYPTATFTLTEPAEVPAGATAVDLAGDMTIRGVTQPVTVAAQIASDGEGVQVVGSVPVTFADFGVEAPSLGFVTVEDDGAVEFDLRLVPEG
ncbi:YceI family protein [Xylanimonas oleitrophica]|uniref:YceI family protein n=1 Tax=Xylanimonas oleitrophica TaxID=2607479 RepID=A0A2W5WYC5_9MICO|nr:YceI family protein [Xylanimonas oleitrophica]PZR53316.1 YceI family protein [Xylanimonas oleitrophica]